MDAKQAIIEKIKADGKALAQSFLNEARQKAETEINNARAYALDYQNKVYAQIEKEKRAIVYRKVSQAQIEAKKDILAEKQRIIEKIFDEVYAELAKGGKEYKEFLLSLIEKYCEDGDTVAVSKDAQVLSEADIAAIAEKKGVKLTLQKEKGNYSGVILKSGHYDKKLTLAELLRQVKEEHITEISDILFEGTL
jgi:V/A-type H+-transporting ATPase subunit E